jgi:predicted dehydrogenase
MRLIEVKKFIRYVKIYGLRRALYKAAGRKRVGHSAYFSGNLKNRPRRVGVIGCGQFAFASLGAMLEMYAPARFARSYDINKAAQQSFEKFFGISKTTADVADICSDESIDTVYVVSNHATHAGYAVQLIKAGKVAYVEKPLAASWKQLSELTHLVGADFRKIYCGYNRPFSAAIGQLKEMCTAAEAPLTLNFYIVGHFLGPDHWYRNPSEGGRVCGNMGHWLDLAVHILAWHKIPDQWAITVVASDEKIKDENVSIVMVSERGDIVTLTLTSRSEPFEGVNESVMLQWGDLNAKIDDFRDMKVWKNDFYRTYSYWPKDVGHKRAILQPFTADENKSQRWHEVKMSTVLMLRIEEMLLLGENQIEFSFAGQSAKHDVHID